MYIVEDTKKITTSRIRQMKGLGEKIAMLTAYDFTTASLVDKAGVDIILVGDSAANVKAGYDTTLPIGVDEMIYHARSVSRAVKRALVVCDMPFGSYQISTEDGVRNAVRMMKEGRVNALKIEGGEEYAEVISHIVRAGIPVMGHLGLTPQSVHQFGGYGVRAKQDAEVEKLLSDARVLEACGVFAIVVEKIPSAVAERVAKTVCVPVIGIGAGNKVDGQVLVVDDMLGMNQGFKPQFLRVYADLHKVITEAVGTYVEDVKNVSFPSESESY